MNDVIKQKALDELAKSPGVRRKVSTEQTLECPIWSPFDQLWIESDEQLRKRLKQESESK